MKISANIGNTTSSQPSLLLDAGAAVSLLRKDLFDRILAPKPVLEYSSL